MKKMTKYFAYMAGIIKGRITAKNIPLFVTVCVTSRCNLRCVYCYEEYLKGSRKEFSKKEILSLIDELGVMGTRYISINGGECLVRDDIGEIVDKINSKGMLCHISTNGILVRKHIDVLKKADSIAISIDGIGESNDVNRGAGSYEKIIDAFECLKQNNIQFHTHTVLTKNNRNAVEEIMALAGRYMFKAQFSFLRVEDSPQKDLGLNDPEIRDLTRKIMILKKKGMSVFFSLDSYRSALEWPFSYDTQMVDNVDIKGKCYMKRFSCHIEADGRVFPCVVLVNKFNALNFLEVGFKRAWEHSTTSSCNACYNVCLNDLNRIFALHPKAVLNALDIVRHRVMGSK